MLERGRALFNSGRYFEAHEVWEAAWLEETGESRRRLQGLIQIAAALHKASRGEHPRGCLLLLDWGLSKLEAVADYPAGFDVARLRSHLTAFRAQAERWQRGESGPPAPVEFPKLARTRSPRRRIRGNQRSG